MKVTVLNVQDAITVMQRLVAWADDVTGSTTVPVELARRTLADMLQIPNVSVPPIEQAEMEENVKVYFKDREFRQVPDYSAQDPAAVAEV